MPKNKLRFELANVNATVLLTRVMGQICVLCEWKASFNGFYLRAQRLYADNSSGEVSFLRTGVMIAVIINTALLSP